MTTLTMDTTTLSGFRVRHRVRGYALGGALLAAVWLALWSFFAVAIVRPAVELHGGGAPASVQRAARL